MQYHIQFIDRFNNQCGFKTWVENGEQEAIDLVFDLFDAVEIVSVEKII